MAPLLRRRSGGELSLAELSALRLDGLLHEIGDAYMPTDAPETAAVRAASLAPILGREYAATGPSAAWVHGAGDAPPSRHHVHPCVNRRLRTDYDPRLIVHQAPLLPEQIERMAGVAVMTITATFVDLARIASSPGATEWLHALAREHPTEIVVARELLAAYERLPGKRRAIATLMTAYEEVTR